MQQGLGQQSQDQLAKEIAPDWPVSVSWATGAQRKHTDAVG